MKELVVYTPLSHTGHSNSAGSKPSRWRSGYLWRRMGNRITSLVLGTLDQLNIQTVDRSRQVNRPLNSLPIITFALLLCLGIVSAGCTVGQDFRVAYSPSNEDAPAVAFNSKNNTFLVAYLEVVKTISGSPTELRVRLFDSTGKVQGGVLQPLGSGSHQALGRPDIAYSPKSDIFFVAVPERTSTHDRVIGRFLDGKGNSLIGPEFLFEGVNNIFYDGPGPTRGPGSLHVTYNSILDEFLVTVQQTINGKNGVWGQKITPSGSLSSVVQLLDSGIHGFNSHGIAYAPVAGTNPKGGRYLFTVSGTPELLDANLKPILVTAADPTNPTVPTESYIQLNKGEPESDFFHFDVAYGEVAGKKRFLVVWADGDNCRPGIHPCPNQIDQWTGVWGTYIDPEKMDYKDLTPGTKFNTPFPISKIPVHKTGKYEYKPQVSYSEDAKAFFVAWREIPTDDPSNDAKLSHIRGTWVDYFVPDGLYKTTTVKEPNKNIVVSNVSGSCQTSWPFLCLSKQDPGYPAVAGMNGKAAAIVWQQQNQNVANILDVFGDIVKMP